MSSDTPDMPSDLWARLRDEPSREQADLEAVWSLLGSVDLEDTEADPDAAWSDVVDQHPELKAASENGRVESAPERPSSRRKARRGRPAAQRRGLWSRATAAAVVAVVVIVAGLWFWRQPVTVTASPGQQRTVQLPDGSTAELNSGTTLSYRRRFEALPFIDAGRRTIRLEGEAFFEVTEGTRPFIVRTENAQVSVLGTRFNVRARTEQGQSTEVTVVRGRVRLAPRARPTRTVTLSERGLTSRVVASRLSPTAPESTNVDHVLAWRNDGFSARARALSSVIQELERRYNTTIRLHPSVNRRDDPITLYYPGPTDVETILHDLCTVRGLKYRATSRGFEVFAKSDSS